MVSHPITKHVNLPPPLRARCALFIHAVEIGIIRSDFFSLINVLDLLGCTYRGNLWFPIWYSRNFRKQQKSEIWGQQTVYSP